MKTNENPLLFRIAVMLGGGKKVRYTGLYQSSNSLRLYNKTGFTYGFWYGWYHSYGAPNQNIYLQMFFLSQRINRSPQWSVSTPSGTQSPWKNQITDSEETWNRCSYTTWTKQWWHHTHSQKRLTYRKNVDSKRELFSCISKRQARDVSDKQIVKYWYENTSSELLEMLAELWIEFGSGKSYRDIPVHIPHQQLGLSKSLALPLFHSRLWYSTFPTFWAVARKILLTETWIVLTNDSGCLTLESVDDRIERFVVLRYSIYLLMMPDIIYSSLAVTC